MFCFGNDTGASGDSGDEPHNREEAPSFTYQSKVVPTIQPSMLQTNQYKVLVVGYRQTGNRGLFAQVYDSQSKQWSVVGSGEQSWGRIFGYEYHWMEDDVYYTGERQGPCVYDFAQGQLHRFNGNDIAQGRRVKSYALLKDRPFVLHRKPRPGSSNLFAEGEEVTLPRYYVSEYELQRNVWVKVETRSCEPFDDYPVKDHHLLLHACNGFLMVIGQAGDMVFGNPEVAHDKYECAWLYNLSTFRRHELPKVPGACDDVGPLGLMCELSWSAVP